MSIRYRLALVVILLPIVGCLVTHTTPFGQIPKGQQLERIKKLPNYQDGQFQNLVYTPQLSEGVSLWQALWDFTKKAQPLRPTGPIPTERTDLNKLAPKENVLVWMGHSSTFVQLSGKRLLIDPVLSKNGAPVSFINKAYPGTTIYQPADIPDIDVLLISHDHWDHLDYPTVSALRTRVKKVICGIGTGEHFRRWGYSEQQIEERNWYEQLMIDSALTITVTPARHDSGRGLQRKKTLWVSFVIQTPGLKLFYSGDTGYGAHFKTIGQQYGPFNIALIECGQYDKNWAYIHMQPEQSLQAGIDLQATHILPVHWGRFTESNHAWIAPIQRISKAAMKIGMPLVTPKIGEVVNVNSPQVIPAWWEEVDNIKQNLTLK